MYCAICVKRNQFVNVHVQEIANFVVQVHILVTDNDELHVQLQKNKKKVYCGKLKLQILKKNQAHQ